jgi:predicted dehydrogenase
MSSKDKIRIGIVGAGGMVRNVHLPGLRKIPEVEVVVVCNRTRESAERVSREFGIAEIETDWRRLVRREDLDAVLIGTWPDMHCPVAVAALEAGKHVFCQARMSRNLSEAREMLRAAECSCRVAMVCPTQHGLKGDRTMRRLLAEGVAGQPHLVRVTSLSSTYADPAQPLHWRQDPAINGRNVLLLGAYVEVLHRWLGYARSLSAQMWTVVSERPNPNGDGKVHVEIPDSLAIIGQMESGARLNVVMSGAVRGNSQNTLEIHGDRGTLVYDFGDNAIRVAQGGEPWRTIAIPSAKEGGWTAEEDFIAAIRHGSPVHPNFHDGTKYMEFIEAVWRSNESDCRVDLDELALI